MLILISILLIFLVLTNLLNSYLLYKQLPGETQKEVVRSRPLYKSKTKIKDWEPPKSKEEEAAEKVQKNL